MNTARFPANQGGDKHTAAVQDVSDLFVIVDVLFEEDFDLLLVFTHCRAYSDDILVRVVADL